MMERMGNIINKFMIISLIYYSCNTFLIQRPNTDKEWNEIALDKLKKEYSNYKKTYISNCWDKKRDLDFDYFRKYEVISDFKYDKHLDKLLNKLKNIKFDSIVSINVFDPQKDEVDYPFFETSFLIFKKNKEILDYSTQEYDGEITINKSDNSYNFYKINDSKRNGWECGIVVLTSINRNLKIIKLRVIINPNNIWNVRFDD